MKQDIERCARDAIEQKVFPGCVIGIVRTNGHSTSLGVNEREILPFGYLTYESDSPEVREDTIYDLASVTKSIPVASLCAMFVAGGKLKLDDPVKKYIPELQNDFGATIEDLLRYRVQGPRMSELNYPTFEQIRTAIFEQGFVGLPGESEYTNLPAFLLGIVLERIGGQILPALADKYFFNPLKMNDTTFFPIPPEREYSDISLYSNIAPTEVVAGVEICGIVHDESARMFAEKRRAVGHAGLFSTAPDLLNFLEALLRYKGEPFVSVVDAAQQGLGWQFNEFWMSGLSERGLTSLKSSRFGKTGFTGTSVVVDREQRIGLVILSNRTYPTRPPDAASLHAAIYSFRTAIADIVFSA